MEKARLRELYVQEIRPQLQKTLALKNIMEVPKIEKIVLNVGVKEAISDSKAIQGVIEALAKITGQAPVRRLARKSIAGFKLREGMAIGAMVTLRGDRMYTMLDRLINLALPKVRDFQGVKTGFDRRGNYNLGIKDWTIFPEMSSEAGEKTHGLNITIQTSAETDAQGFELLKSFGMPFRK
ncbi:MAG: 50S ribosomal protein L5 [Candidatus Dependentiae bacterium]|nr:50S ribosomal protein L5 [Candidatus Dependentiae bacterium]